MPNSMPSATQKAEQISDHIGANSLHPVLPNGTDVTKIADTWAPDFDVEAIYA